MKTRLIWKDSWINNGKDSFWIECTNDEVIKKILPFVSDDNFINEIEHNKGYSKINPNENEKIYCNFFLVSKDLLEIKSFNWVYPYSGMWNASNPFEEIDLTDFNSLDFLTEFKYTKKIRMEKGNIGKLEPTNVLFIKLGKGGEFSADCIKDNYLKLNYHNVDHDLCIRKDWESVYNFFIHKENATKSVATSHVNQIRQFYEEDINTLWITFHKNKLWWCFSKPDIKKLNDGKKIRPVIGKWSDKDFNDKALITSNLSGKLLKTHGFQGTICKVSAQSYVIAKINGEQKKELVEVEEAYSTLKRKLELLIEHLQWQDFEILIDLIFRQMGWQRVSVLGKDLKTLDIELLSPVTGEKGIVQIKTGADLEAFRKYKTKFDEMDDYDKFFFVVSSPKADLENYENETDINLYLTDKISELTISSGLVDWVIRKSS